MIYRTRKEVEELGATLPETAVSEVVAEPGNAYFFLNVRKPKAGQRGLRSVEMNDTILYIDDDESNLLVLKATCAGELNVDHRLERRRGTRDPRQAGGGGAAGRSANAGDDRCRGLRDRPGTLPGFRADSDHRLHRSHRSHRGDQPRPHPPLSEKTLGARGAQGGAPRGRGDLPDPEEDRRSGNPAARDRTHLRPRGGRGRRRPRAAESVGRHEHESRTRADAARRHESQPRRRGFGRSGQSAFRWPTPWKSSKERSRAPGRSPTDSS